MHLLAGTFVRVSHKEISISHPDAVNQLLIARLHKVSAMRGFIHGQGRSV